MHQTDKTQRCKIIEELEIELLGFDNELIKHMMIIAVLVVLVEDGWGVWKVHLYPCRLRMDFFLEDKRLEGLLQYWKQNLFLVMMVEVTPLELADWTGMRV